MLKRSDKIAVIGSDGIPNRYGGFETLALELHSRSDQFVIISSGFNRNKESRINIRNIYLPLPSNGWSNIIFDSVSIVYAMMNYRNILVLGSTLSPFLVLASLVSSITLNIGGIDWKRKKWGFIARFILRFAEGYSIGVSRNLVCDNKYIGKYIKAKYGRSSTFIPYGVSNVQIISQKQEKYFLSILRIQEDNNVDIVLEAFSNVNERLIIVGNWEVSSYSKKLREAYQSVQNIEMLDAVYDADIITNLRSHCMAYVHPHSAGGTNPSLVEILPYNKPILAYSNGFNEETLLGEGYFWKNCKELESLINADVNLDPVHFHKKFQQIYNWSSISLQYLKLCRQ